MTALSTINNGDSGLSVRTTLNSLIALAGANYPFTSGSIPFFNGSGNIAQDNAAFSWDDTNKDLLVKSGAGKTYTAAQTGTIFGEAGYFSTTNVGAGGITINNTTGNIFQIMSTGSSPGAGFSSNMLVFYNPSIDSAGGAYILALDGATANVQIASDSMYGWGTQRSYAGTTDYNAGFWSSGAGCVDQYYKGHFTSPNSFRVYNTTDGAVPMVNYERGVLDFTTFSNTFLIGTQAAGTGTSRPIVFVQGGSTAFDIGNSAAGLVTFQYGCNFSGGPSVGFRFNNSTSAHNLEIDFSSTDIVQFYNNSVGVVNLSVGTGASSYVATGADGQFGWTSTAGNANLTIDTALRRESAGVLALRNGTNAQKFNVYNTYTDASNYERAKFGWNSNVLEIGSEKAGTGSTRNIAFLLGGSDTVDFKSSLSGAYNAPSGGIPYIALNTPGWPNASFALVHCPNGGNVLPVPTFYPLITNSLLAIDFCPNGSPSDVGFGIAWNDICNKDQITGGGSVAGQTLHLSAGSSTIDVRAGVQNGASQFPLVFGQINLDNAAKVNSFQINTDASVNFTKPLTADGGLSANTAPSGSITIAANYSMLVCSVLTVAASQTVTVNANSILRII